MNKSLTILLFICVISFFCNAQNIIQISNDGNRNNSYQQQECPYRINGICSTEDIGGVDFEERMTENGREIFATNYNSFTVTVLFKIGYGRSSRYGIEKEVIITKVLKPNDEKSLGLSTHRDRPLVWGYHLTYSITRRMGN